jgi:threonine dehydrogenase-like Zn-dependent dehydrogenase
MGGIYADIAIPHADFMHRDLQMKGKWMYSRRNVWDLIKMIERGVLKLDEGENTKIQKFGLNKWSQAFDAAADKQMVAVFVPVGKAATTLM